MLGIWKTRPIPWKTPSFPGDPRLKNIQTALQCSEVVQVTHTWSRVSWKSTKKGGWNLIQIDETILFVKITSLKRIQFSGRPGNLGFRMGCDGWKMLEDRRWWMLTDKNLGSRRSWSREGPRRFGGVELKHGVQKMEADGRWLSFSRLKFLCRGLSPPAWFSCFY